MENLSVLVLDHDPVSLLTISNTLANLNFKVMRFQTAEEALDSLEKGVVNGEELDLVVAEVHHANTAMDALVVFHQILDALEVPFVTMCAYDDVEAVSERVTLGSCFNVLKPFGTETINILLHKARQHKSRRVLHEGSSILKKTQGRKDSSSAKNRGSKTEDEEPDVSKAHSYSKKLCRFTWSSHLHEKFLRAVEVLGESATPRKIRRHMDVKNFNLTLDHISSHLQKHRLREQKAKQEEEEKKKYASMKLLSDLITSSHKQATPEPINHPTTTQRQITHGDASANRDKYRGNLRAQVEERSPKASVVKTNVRPTAVSKRPAMSVWDKYEEGLQCGERPPKRISATYKPKFLPVKSKAIDGYGGIANISQSAAGEMGYGAPAIVPVESSGSNSMLTSLLEQLEEDTRRTEAAGNNVNLDGVTLQACYYTMNQVHHAVNLQKDAMNQVNTSVNLQKYTMNQVHTVVAPQGNSMNGVHAAAMVADGLVGFGSSNLLGTGSSRSTAEKTPSDPTRSWEETEAFLMSQLQGEEQGGDDLLQADDAWYQVLQPANIDNAPVAQTNDVPAAQEPATGDALPYDPEFSIDDVQPWSPQFATNMACRSSPGKRSN